MSQIVKKEQAKLATKLCKETHFSKNEIEILLKIFSQYLSSDTNITNGKLDRGQFRDILHNTFEMTDDILMDRVFKVFDRLNDNYIDQEEWVLGLSTILRGTLDEKMKYCFTVYDLNSDGCINREEMFHLLKNSLVSRQTEEDPDEGTKDLIEHVVKKMGSEPAGRLSLQAYQNAVRQDNLLLECFGPCLPSDSCQAKFLQQIADHKNTKS